MVVRGRRRADFLSPLSPAKIKREAYQANGTGFFGRPFFLNVGLRSVEKKGSASVCVRDYMPACLHDYIVT